MKALHSRILLAISCCASLALACSKDDKGTQDAIDGSGGTVSGSGGAQGGVLNRDLLAQNCKGLEVEDAGSCNQAELVCSTQSGTLCICGGVPAETGQVSGNDGGNDDDWRGPRQGSGGNTENSSSSGDLMWVCYAIGPPVQDDGNGGEGGGTATTDQGGEGGSF